MHAVYFKIYEIRRLAFWACNYLIENNRVIGLNIMIMLVTLLKATKLKGCLTYRKPWYFKSRFKISIDSKVSYNIKQDSNSSNFLFQDWQLDYLKTSKQNFSIKLYKNKAANLSVEWIKSLSNSDNEILL